MNNNKFIFTRLVKHIHSPIFTALHFKTFPHNVQLEIFGINKVHVLQLYPSSLRS